MAKLFFKIITSSKFHKKNMVDTKKKTSLKNKRANHSTKSGSQAVLVLADGSVFDGHAFGHHCTDSSPAIGEVVFNTSMYGYQEILTDPSYAGQILTFTSPHIGNVGCNLQDEESEKVFATGCLVRELSSIESNFRSEMSLSEYLKNEAVMGITGFDTRALVNHLRNKGSQMGAMACGDSLSIDKLATAAKSAGSMEGKDYVKAVSCKQNYSWEESVWSLALQNSGGFKTISNAALSLRPHCVAVDCGIKRNILRLLTDVGFRVSVVPATATAEDIMSLKPDGLFLSNGPGDPATLGYVVNSVKNCLGKIPIFGICLGHQILGQVFGAKTYKLKFGHRGGNHPVMDLRTKKVEITVQNHGFAIDGSSLSKDAEISHLNLNDQTVEGIESSKYKAFSVQYHPEASPGPHDSAYLFKRFFELVVN